MDQTFTVYVVYADFLGQKVALERTEGDLFQFHCKTNVRELGAESTVFGWNECFEVVWGRIDASMHTVSFLEFPKQRLTRKARFLTTLFCEIDVPLPNMHVMQ